MAGKAHELDNIVVENDDDCGGGGGGGFFLRLFSDEESRFSAVADLVARGVDGKDSRRAFLALPRFVAEDKAPLLGGVSSLAAATVWARVWRVVGEAY